MKKKLNNMSVIRVTLLTVILFICTIAAMYWAAGTIEIPAESPLADPNYKIRILPEVTAERDAPLDPASPSNLLYGGKDWTSAIVSYAVFIAIIVATAYISRKGKNCINGILTVNLALLTFVKFLSQDLAETFFLFSNLRAGAQSLIDNNYRLRVIIACVDLWSRQYDNYPKNITTFTLVGIMLISAIIAGLIEYIFWAGDASAIDTAD